MASMDMTHGPLAGNIFKFALPLAATGILQQLFNAADVAVVGNFCNKEAMAAVGSNSSIIGLFVGFFVGISIGANVVIAHFTGSGDTEKAKKAVHTAVLIAPLFGIFITLIGELAAAPLLHAMNVPDNVYPMSLAYLRIYMAGVPFILLYNFESAVFRSQGNTKTPLLCLTAAGVINVFGNLFFVIVVGMTADGVALATVLSNVVSSLLMLVLLIRDKDSVIGLHKEYLRIDRHLLRRILEIGVPAGLQSMVFSLSNIVIQSAINSLGSDIMAASSAAFNIEIFAYYVINAFGQACTTFTSQNYGAGDADRCRKALRISMLQDFISAAIIIGIILFFGRDLLALFNDDAVVIKYGYIRLQYIITGEFLNVLMEIFSGSLRGYGHSMEPALITIVGVVGVRIVWVYTVFARHHGFDTLLTCYPVSWAVTAALLIICYFRLRGKIAASISRPSAAAES